MAIGVPLLEHLGQPFACIELHLPFNHVVIGFIMPGNNRVFVTWVRDHPMHPFGTHEIAADGECESGRYFETRNEALLDMAQRARLIPAS